MREATRSAKRVTSACSFSTLASVPVLEMADTDGAATSTTLSAMSAILARSVVSAAEARTIRTFAGRRWRNSSLRKALSSPDGPRWSPRSCCIRRSSWVGLRSPSSSPLISCCSFRCSEAAVRLMSSALSVS